MHLSPGPISKLIASIRYVRNRLHYRVGPGPGLGVVFDRGRWTKDPHATFVSPLGAAILEHQPRTAEILEAAQLAIGCESLTSILGLIDGIARQSPRSSSLRGGIHTRIYVNALEAGYRLRAVDLTTVCPDHKIRHLEVMDCPACKTARGQS